MGDKLIIKFECPQCQVEDQLASIIIEFPDKQQLCPACMKKRVPDNEEIKGSLGERLANYN